MKQIQTSAAKCKWININKIQYFLYWTTKMFSYNYHEVIKNLVHVVGDCSGCMSMVNTRRLAAPCPSSTTPETTLRPSLMRSNAPCSYRRLKSEFGNWRNWRNTQSFKFWPKKLLNERNIILYMYVSLRQTGCHEDQQLGHCTLLFWQKYSTWHSVWYLTKTCLFGMMKLSLIALLLLKAILILTNLIETLELVCEIHS